MMRDASEYRFNAGERRVTVRSAAPSGSATDLAKAGEEYRERCESLLGATAVTVTDPSRIANGAELVTVSATLPDGRLRVALLRFGDGSLVELSLTTAPNDAGADAEFARLLASARPSAATPTQSVARGLAASLAGDMAHPAGPLLLDLANYTANPEFALETLDGLERYEFNKTTVLESTRTNLTRSGPTAPHLARDIGTAVGADGKIVQFEMSRPRPFTKQVSRAIEPVLESAVRGRGRDSEGTIAKVVTGTVADVAIQVRMAGSGATAQKAKRLLDELRDAN